METSFIVVNYYRVVHFRLDRGAGDGLTGDGVEVHTGAGPAWAGTWVRRTPASEKIS